MTKKKIARLNDMLGRDLGRNERGESIYSWRWADDLKHHMLVDGWDYKADPESGLLVAHPIYEERKLCSELSRQWVMVMWQPPISEAAWRRTFGISLEWPRNGMYVPCSHVNGYVSLDPEVEPDERLTKAFVEEMKKQRAKRYVDHLQESEQKLAQSEKDIDRRLEDQIDDLVGPYASVPGKRGYHVSFPDPKIQAKG